MSDQNDTQTKVDASHTQGVADTRPVLEPGVSKVSDVKVSEGLPDKTHVGGPRFKLNESMVVDALERSHGLKGIASDFLGVSFSTLEKYIRRFRTAQEVVEHWRTKRKDNAEFKLDEAIGRGEPWAIAFTLKNARDREYNDKIDLNASGQLTSLTEEELLLRLAAVLRSRRKVIQEFIDVEAQDIEPQPNASHQQPQLTDNVTVVEVNTPDEA